MPYPSRAALLALLVVAGLGGFVAVAASGGVAETHSQSAPATNATNATDTTIVVALDSDGDATWNISTSFDLETAEQANAYTTLATSFESGDEPALGLATFERVVDRVTLVENRQMSITDIDRTTAPEQQVSNGTGWLSVSFTWENFARTDGNEMYVDDVLTTENGPWFQGLDDGETLLIRSPPGFGVLSANVDKDFVSIVGDGSIRWTGPASFDDTSLQTSFIGNGGTSPPPENGSSFPTWVLGAAVVFAGVALVVYVVWRRRPDAGTGDERPETGTGTAGAAGTAETAAPDAEDTPVDEELLSDEERVKHLLERNGGRMKQADIVDETDWSNAKVSQLLSAMEEDGEINKLRIGRENLISFPEENVAELDEPD
ncbi:MAG: hypothetical protein V5A55_05745 [Halovenus sp.]